MSLAVEQLATDTHRDAALQEAREMYPRYFEAFAKHPRLLVGMEVPSLTDDSMVTLRSSEDAKDWQEAAKQLIAAEVQSNAEAMAEGSRETLELVHSSIAIFQNNKDLVPGTREFNRQLADDFVKLAKAYEVRPDGGKLLGYSIPVQPLIDQARARLKAAKQPVADPKAGAPASTSTSPKGKVAPAARGPQRGIPAKSGNSSEAPEDFSVLFGTLGLPNFRI